MWKNLHLKLCIDLPTLHHMQDFRLIYASVAREGLGYDDLMSILRVASPRNRSLGISGLLCYGDGAFLQVLEGERTRLNQLYAGIMRDARHTNLILLGYSEISARDFSEWSMKMINWDAAPNAKRRELHARHFDGQEFLPSSMSAAQALPFMVALADQERLLARAS
jgi:hypothetical protein